MFRNLKAFLDYDGIEHGIVVKNRGGLKTVITASHMIEFNEAVVELVVKKGKTYIMLSQMQEYVAS